MKEFKVLLCRILWRRCSPSTRYRVPASATVMRRASVRIISKSLFLFFSAVKAIAMVRKFSNCLLASLLKPSIHFPFFIKLPLDIFLSSNPKPIEPIVSLFSIEGKKPAEKQIK